MLKRKDKGMDLGKVVAIKTVRTIFGESFYYIYERSITPWEEGTEISHVNGYRVTVTIVKI